MPLILLAFRHPQGSYFSLMQTTQPIDFKPFAHYPILPLTSIQHSQRALSPGSCQMVLPIRLYIRSTAYNTDSQQVISDCMICIRSV